MNARQLFTIAIAALLMVGGVAALGAASPPDHASNADDADEPVEAGEERADESDGVGPADGLSEQVPDHVTEIHDRISSFLDGALDSLGEALSDLLGSQSADDASDDAQDSTGDGTDD